MKKYAVDILVSPKTLLPLKYEKGALTDSENNTYRIWNGIPILLPDDNSFEWHRELMEAILWEYPDELNKMYSRIQHNSDPNIEYKITITKLLKNKNGIKSALERYAENKTDKWIAKEDLSDEELQKAFKKYSTYSNGRKRVKTKRRPKNTFIYKSYKKFKDVCFKNNPKTIIELATGAGGGTASLAINMSKNTKLYTVDIAPDCLANAFGIAKYTNRKKIFPICANFWYLPFKDESAELICTFCGLDESRENNKTLSEINRILKTGGSFVCVSRKNSFMRQAKILEDFGFTEKECEELMKKCRLYSSFDELKNCCAELGMENIYTEEITKDEKTVFVISEFKKLFNYNFKLHSI